MNANPQPLSATTVPAPVNRRAQPEFTWATIAARAPRMAATMGQYLDQLTVSSRPATVDAASLTLRLFAGHITTTDPTCVSVTQIGRPHIEAHKLWLAARPGRHNKPLSATTISHRLGMLRTFFDRIIEWDYPDTPPRTPIWPGDFPQPDEPLPKFLDDPTAAKFMAALANDPNPRRRLMVELLARTGIRSGELSALEHDAMITIGDNHWLRIPVGKLHNDRNIPLPPILVELITNWQATTPPTRTGRLVERNDGQPFDRRTIHRYVATVAKRAGISHVHPHQLRHSLATQAINQGMSLEAIAALLGHRSMNMTLTYARITDRTIADQYFAVTQAVEDNYNTAEPLPADTSGPNTPRLATDHQRLLGNGHCTRPAALDCQHETICERCGLFATGPQFAPVLIRQRDHATSHNQPDRALLYTQLLDHIDEDQ